MSVRPSPLRYPGGKSPIWQMISEIIRANGLERGHYVEPYAGGCGLALTLFFRGYVHELHLNDIDRSIFCFWRAVLNRTDEFIEKILATPVTVDEWYLQRSIQKNKQHADEFDLAFSTFFLNRTNRSGVIANAGVIGGLAQAGRYKIDCRFNKTGLIERIQRIAKYKHRVHFYSMDALKFLDIIKDELPKHQTFFCIDPPYYEKGSMLYANFYENEDHANIAKYLNGLKRSWVLTYDNVEPIRNLYNRRRQFAFNLNYSAATKRVGQELLITSDRLTIPDLSQLQSVA